MPSQSSMPCTASMVEPQGPLFQASPGPPAHTRLIRPAKTKGWRRWGRPSGNGLHHLLIVCAGSRSRRERGFGRGNDIPPMHWVYINAKAERVYARPVTLRIWYGWREGKRDWGQTTRVHPRLVLFTVAKARDSFEKRPHPPATLRDEDGTLSKDRFATRKPALRVALGWGPDIDSHYLTEGVPIVNKKENKQKEKLTHLRIDTTITEPHGQFPGIASLYLNKSKAHTSA